MEKTFKYGLVLGKFMPPQNGHCFLIDSAAAQCQKLYVMICSTSTQEMPGRLRYEWLCEIYRNNRNIEIIHIDADVPQFPEEAESVDSFYLDYWVPIVYSRIKNLNVLFTSEFYGDEFAKYLNVKHVMLDQPRSTYAVSATDIRTDPFGHWEYIPRVVRHYYMKKVCIMGSESTGKSTMSKFLANHFNTKPHGAGYVEEYGRTYTEEVSTKDLTANDFDIIAAKHWLTMKNATPATILFIDTEAMTTKIFGEMYVPGFKSELIEEIIEEQDYDLYLLLDIDVPWINDGTREFGDPEVRERHMERIQDELEAQGIDYTLISGTYKEREEQAILAVEELLSKELVAR
jgi:HTH-type transcriptional repressor of NAD biosynthesis genes